MNGNQDSLRLRVQKKSFQKILLSSVFLILGIFLGYQIIRTYDQTVVSGIDIIYKSLYSYLFAATALIIAVVLFFRGLTPILDPDSYPPIKRLPSKTGFDRIQEQYQNTPAENRTKLDEGVIFTLAANWLIKETRWNIKFYKSDDFLWAYREVIKTKLYGVITTETTENVVIKATYYSLTLLGDEKYIDAFLQRLSMIYPWIDVGYSEQLQARWDYNRDEFVASAKDRKKDADHVDMK